MIKDQIQKSREESPRERGFQDYFRLKGHYQNPYSLNSEEFNEYERGWMQSLKRDDGKLIPSAFYKKAGEPAAKRADEFNRYAEEKGRSAPRNRLK
jgi:hypothetical protein